MATLDDVLRNMQDGAFAYSCAGTIAAMDKIERAEVLTAICLNRMERKYNKISEIFERTNNDWEQTYYAMLMRSMDIGKNRVGYEAIAEALPYRIIRHEKNGSSPLVIEALLLGTSGLLSRFEEHPYIAKLRNEYSYLAHKYDLSPIEYKIWDLKSYIPASHPVIRLAQVASILHKTEFIVSEFNRCTTVRDIENMFRVYVSEEWKEILHLDRYENRHTLALHPGKAHLLGINLIAQLQAFYGHHIGDMDMSERAIQLLDAIPPENNVYTRRWSSCGLRAKSALESQAIIQLSTIFCAYKNCAKCPVWRRVAEKIYLQSK